MMIALFAAILSGCERPCDEGFAKADDGICYPTGTTGQDGGATDGGATDGGDSGVEDGGVEDGGVEDGGGADGGGADGGVEDGGGADGGGADGGGADGGAPDGGAPDGGAGDGGATGATITVSGDFVFGGDIETGANCSVWMWAEESIDSETGFPDRLSYTDMGFVDITCPAEAGLAATYVGGFPLDTAQTVYFFAMVDQDGDLLTVTDRTSGGSTANPVAVTPKGSFDHVDFTLVPLDD